MPVAVVLPVLSKWCRNYESDRAVLFESKALMQLFEHYLQDLIKGEVSGSVHDKYESPWQSCWARPRPVLSFCVRSLIPAEQARGFVQNMAPESAERSAVCRSLSAHLVSRIRISTAPPRLTRASLMLCS